ncbi:hypothetical protein LCGC14_1787640 [marine sediment metagenome]|uniref:Uncharacterized protein n=1 Tax=marine sediment metagenome TaxID=412755 RepID=A0A0F9J8D8_9ZZZZ|nr:glycosyltransferase [Actinomycetota bacterium]
MLQQVSMGYKDIKTYEPIMGTQYIDELKELANKLKGLRILYINSTPFGGGVAELLSAYLPLMIDLGIDAEWRIIYGDKYFFSVTKKMHNALQGAPLSLTQHLREHYLGNIMANVEKLDAENYDVVIVNDPQPAALLSFIKSKNGSKWIWRAHIDMSSPNPQVWQFLKPHIEKYDAAIFTMKEFIPKDLKARTAIIPPAIDVSNTKNMDLPPYLPRAVLKNSGVDISHPVILQVSRFDPWKDPLGVIESYRLVKQEIPEVQLVLVGALAQDDPEGWAMYGTINREAVKDPDMYLFTNQTSTGSLEVNALQRACDVVIQKSIREGFGLVVSEALWKAKPVVAGRAGGIKLQMTGKLEDFLIDSTEDAAKKIVQFLESPQLMEEYGALGRENVRKNFLMPRYIKEELELIADLVKA